MTLSENPDLVARLEHCRDLPTPPGVAERIIALSSDANSDISALAEIVSFDPALTAKVLRMANSSMYARQAKVETLEQAVMMFGWNGTLNLALSFSLVSNINTNSNNDFDYNFFWKRSVTAAVSAKHLSTLMGIDSRKEDLFLPGLLQDIGMLALVKAIPDLYMDHGDDLHQHKIVQQIEYEKLGIDHAAVGAWLLNRWNLPNNIIELVAISHREEDSADDLNTTSAEKCIEVSNVIADCICSDENKKDYQYTADVCQKVLGLNNEEFLENLEKIIEELKETAAIFELDVGDSTLLNCMAEQAKELLLLRSMETLKTAEDLHKEAEYLGSKARELEDSAKIDTLTNIFNRSYLEKVIHDEFESSKLRNTPLTIVMIDLDKFKKINDTYGHSCGDKALIYAVSILKSCMRDTDSLFRYGGEEFVAMLPNTNTTGAESFATRIIEAFNKNKFIAEKENINILLTASLGIAIHGEDLEFDNWEHLLNIADYCLYASKANGRNQYTLYSEENISEAAVG